MSRYQQPLRLFGPDHERRHANEVVILLSVPSSGGYESALRALRRACKRFEAETRCKARILTGEDAPCQEPAAVRTWLLEQLEGTVCAVIAVHGPSWGTSRIDTLAAQLGIPRLLAFDDGRPRSVIAGTDGSDVLCEGHYRTTAELERLAFEWLMGAPEIRLVAARRDTEALLTDPLRQALLRTWSTRDYDTQRKFAREVMSVPIRVQAALMDQRKFRELGLGGAYRLAKLLRVSIEVRAEPPAVDLLGVLTAQQRAAFEMAKKIWAWDAEVSERVLERGVARIREQRELESAGIRTRDSFTTHRGWQRLYHELCGS